MYQDILYYLIIANIISVIKEKNVYFGEIPKWAFYKEMLEKRPAWAEAQGACGGS